jgi:hypothetical protein
MGSPSVVGGATETLLVESFGPRSRRHAIKELLSTVGSSEHAARIAFRIFYFEAKLSADMVMCSWCSPYH